LRENIPDRSISKKHNANEEHVCVKDDLSAVAGAAGIVRCAKEMENGKTATLLLSQGRYFFFKKREKC